MHYFVVEWGGFLVPLPVKGIVARSMVCIWVQQIFGVEVNMTMLDCGRCGGQILVREGRDESCLQCGRYAEPITLADVWHRWLVTALAKREAEMGAGPTAREGALENAAVLIQRGKSRRYILKATGLSVSDFGRARRSVVRFMDANALL